MKKLPHTFHVTVGKPATPCRPWSPTAGDQLLPEDPLSPATLQPVTPAPDSPGPAAASALLHPALPLPTPCVRAHVWVCTRARPCGQPQKSKLPCIQIVLCSGSSGPDGLYNCCSVLFSLLYSELFHPVSCKRDICCVFSTCQLGNQGLCSGLRLTTQTLWCTMPSQLACFLPQWC